MIKSELPGLPGECWILPELRTTEGLDELGDQSSHSVPMLHPNRDSDLIVIPYPAREEVGNDVSEALKTCPVSGLE